MHTDTSRHVTAAAAEDESIGVHSNCCDGRRDGTTTNTQNVQNQATQMDHQ